MARIRAIKPEFWSSPNLPEDPWPRLLYMAMWNWADDNGVGTATPRELLGFAFPNDENLTPLDLRRMLVEIRRVFDVKFYTVRGRPYYSIPSWEEHQKFDRRSKGKHPGPEQAETWLYQEEQEDSAEYHESPSSTRRDSVAGTGEEGKRGRGEEGSSPTSVRNSPARQPGSKREAALVALVDTAHSQPAHRIALAYQGWLGSPVDSKTLTEVAVVVDELLDDAIPAEQIAGGIKAWHASDSWSPTQIRRFVNKAARPPEDGAGTPTRKATSHLTVADQIIAEMSAS